MNVHELFAIAFTLASVALVVFVRRLKKSKTIRRTDSYGDPR